jgi:UDP-N-acetylglucosamine 2-epimerase (non-hydrolysing)
MADALAAAAPALERTRAPLPAEIGDRSYILATLHRQATADNPGRLGRYLSAFGRLAATNPVVLPVHPRTRKTIEAARLRAPPGVFLLDPQPYLSFLALLKGARLVVTDSGGVQVEAGILGVPCVTARARTEHRMTVDLGLNRLAGADPRRLPRVVEAALAAPLPRARLPKAWDGKASERIVDFWIQAEERGLI